MACKYGIDLGDCRAANDQLIKIGYPSKLNCRDCTLNKASAFAAQRYKETADRDRKAVVKWFKKMGFGPDFAAGASLRTGFRCPIIGETIYRPCSLEHCAYHLDYPWSANCLLAYAHQQDTESLSPEEISYLYQIPISAVKTLLAQAMTALRSSTIDQKADEGGRFEPRFSYFPTDRVCCVCESILEGEVPRSLQIEDFGLVYCSKECREEKHPLLVTLEAQKGLPIDQILEWTLKRFRSLSLAEQALGLPRWLTQEACKKYLDKTLDFYFPSLRTSQDQDLFLIRRTWKTSDSLTQMLTRIQLVSRTVVRHFGPRRVSLSYLRRDLNHLIQNL